MRKFRVRWARLAAVVLAITCVVLASGRLQVAKRLAEVEAAREAEAARMKQTRKELRECELLLHGYENDLRYDRMGVEDILARERAVRDAWLNVAAEQRAAR